MQEMETTTQKLLNYIEINHPILKDIITKGVDELKKYLESLKEEKYEENLNETEEEAIERAEKFFEKLGQIKKSNESLNEKAKETVEILNEMTELFNGIVENTEKEKEKLIQRNNELIEAIIKLEERKINKLIDCNTRKKFRLKGKFEDKKEEWNELRIKIIEPISEPSANILENDEIQQLEEWTEKKMGNIIFDSNIDNWDVETSVFDKKIVYESNLIFLIEDEDGNKFGEYVNAKIYKCEKWINDPKSFVFCLKSNKRLDGMLKFDIQCPHQAFVLFDQSNEFLFFVGQGSESMDICVAKENLKTMSYCQQSDSFNYDGINNALCGKLLPNRFSPKRIVVIKLI